VSFAFPFASVCFRLCRLIKVVNALNRAALERTATAAWAGINNCEMRKKRKETEKSCRQVKRCDA
jgi:hypothetical protein